MPSFHAEVKTLFPTVGSHGRKTLHKTAEIYGAPDAVANHTLRCGVPPPKKNVSCKERGNKTTMSCRMSTYIYGHPTTISGEFVQTFRLKPGVLVDTHQKFPILQVNRHVVHKSTFGMYPSATTASSDILAVHPTIYNNETPAI